MSDIQNILLGIDKELNKSTSETRLRIKTVVQAMDALDPIFHEKIAQMVFAPGTIKEGHNA